LTNGFFLIKLTYFSRFVVKKTTELLPKKVYGFISSEPAKFSIATEQTYTQNLKS